MSRDQLTNLPASHSRDKATSTVTAPANVAAMALNRAISSARGVVAGVTPMASASNSPAKSSSVCVRGAMTSTPSVFGQVDAKPSTRPSVARMTITPRSDEGMPPVADHQNRCLLGIQYAMYVTVHTAANTATNEKLPGTGDNQAAPRSASGVGSETTAQQSHVVNAMPTAVGSSQAYLQKPRGRD